MLMPGKATAGSRPNLHVLATSAVFKFSVGSAFSFFFFCLYARGMICDKNLYCMIFDH